MFTVELTLEGLDVKQTIVTISKISPDATTEAVIKDLL